MPQHNETERQLLALLKKEQDRNSSTVSAPTAVALPEISPLMFLSPSAQREFEAAQAFRPLTVTVPQVPPPEVAVAQVPAGRALASEDFSFNDPDWDIEAELSTTSSVAATPDLDAIFMQQASREIGETSAAQLRAARLLNERIRPEIEFTAADLDVDTSGNFPRYRAPQGGGQVVSQRGPNGFVPVPRHVAVARQTQAQDSRPSAPQAPIKSRFERLLGKSIID